LHPIIILWAIIIILAIAIDVETSLFLFVWFAIGAFCAIIASVLGHGFSVQLITFVTVSVVSIAIGYPIVKKTIKRTVNTTLTMEQTYVGRELTIEENVEEKASIKLDGIYWTVKNEGEPIGKGDKVKIVGLEGNKLLIRKI
jgi:membrane protein implicated in regulation of membrane protease activity